MLSEADKATLRLRGAIDFSLKTFMEELALKVLATFDPMDETTWSRTSCDGLCYLPLLTSRLSCTGGDMTCVIGHSIH